MFSWACPGPVFVYEWLTASRRWQVYALRTLFLTSLLGALTVVWSSDQAAGKIASSASTIRSMATFGGMVFRGGHRHSVDPGVAGSAGGDCRGDLPGPRHVAP